VLFNWTIIVTEFSRGQHRYTLLRCSIKVYVDTGQLLSTVAVADPGGDAGDAAASSSARRNIFWTTIFWACMIVNVLQHQPADNAHQSMSTISRFFLLIIIIIHCLKFKPKHYTDTKSERLSLRINVNSFCLFTVSLASSKLVTHSWRKQPPNFRLNCL